WAQYAGQTYYFCSPSCHSRFNTHPEQFAKPEHVEPHPLSVAAPTSGAAGRSTAPNRSPTQHSPSAPAQGLSLSNGITPSLHSASASSALFVCPMHPEIVRDEPGDCPICGMALEARSISAVSAEDNS